ncbi:MAG TPA: glycosyltransferase [Methanomassiliicoccales archaeon]|nr:glycosyltransferase [Methanomassiliicoccales archaeon]
MISASVGVCAYNEERNIRACLESVSAQVTDGFELREIVVVSSGSTDRTNEIVMEYEGIDARVKLHVQKERAGKNAAINLFIGVAKGEVLVLVNADNRLEPDALSHLIAPFADGTVGMAGGRPVPTNSPDSPTGFAVHMLWEMHHRVALVHPKVGELVAFRPPGIELPLGTQSDEDLIRMELEKKGMRTVYVPSAIVHNHGPENVRDFMRQRTRVNIGERYVRKWFGYELSTWDISTLLQAYGSFAKDHPTKLHLMLFSIAMEATARVIATVHVALDRGDKPVWKQVESTKGLD